VADNRASRYSCPEEIPSYGVQGCITRGLVIFPRRPTFEEKLLADRRRRRRRRRCRLSALAPT
jgi:hypothetical protein